MAFYSTLVRANVDFCDKKVGPAGRAMCVLLAPDYQEHQCATCLTDAYIQLKSGGRHHCEDRTATYCWYQCQIELYGNDKGVVRENCRCKAGEKHSSPKAPLPSHCYSPSGTDCKWYQDCLERRFPCVGTSADYAVKYASYFCAAYEKNYDSFTTLGKRWVDATRKCLQVSLAPLLRECNSNITCEFIEDTAFRSHECCYLGGSECTPPNTPSICEILDDWWDVMITISDALLKITFWHLQTFISSFRITYNCLKDFKTVAYNTVAEKVKGWTKNVVLEYKYDVSFDIEYLSDIYNKVEKFFKQPRMKRSTDNDETHQRDMFAVILLEELSKQLKWDKTKLSWFAFSPNSTKSKLANSSADYFCVNIILVDKFAKASGIRYSMLLDDTVSNLTDKIRKGKIKQIANVVLKTAFDCQDILCRNATEYKALKPKKPDTTPPKTSTTPQQADSASSTYTSITKFIVCFFFTLITFCNVHFWF